MTEIRAHAPGRVNLIGDHTDYAGGLALPMAIDLGTTITGRRGGGVLDLRSERFETSMQLPVPIRSAIDALEPSWSRYVAAIAQQMHSRTGFTGTITSTLPIGAGLSSSASLELAFALALGFEGTPRELAELGHRSEFAAVGVPCGLLDQLSSAFGREGHALLIDFASSTVEEIALPDDLGIVIIHSGVERSLAGSAYAERRAACELAASIIGPLADCAPGAIDQLDDPVVRRRARHIITECQRVRDAVAALRTGDTDTLGRLMVQSHESLRDDFEVSTVELDLLVERLLTIDGVHGARVTGAGFGGCVVAITEPGAIGDPTELTGRGWHVRASGPASVETLAL
jgi:galactokinase